MVLFSCILFMHMEIMNSHFRKRIKFFICVYFRYTLQIVTRILLAIVHVPSVKKVINFTFILKFDYTQYMDLFKFSENFVSWQLLYMSLC